jgi:hypothetical protein
MNIDVEISACLKSLSIQMASSEYERPRGIDESTGILKIYRLKDLRIGALGAAGALLHIIAGRMAYAFT